MYPVTTEFLTKVKESTRTIIGKVEINGVIIDENIIIDMSIESSMGTGKLPTIGGSTANKLVLNLIADTSIPTKLTNVDIKPYVAIQVGTETNDYNSLIGLQYAQLALDSYGGIGSDGVFEWIPLGVFRAETGDVVKTKSKVTIECFDIMPSLDTKQYVSTLTYPVTVGEMLSEMSTNFGLTFATQALPIVTFDVMPQGTVRQVLSYIASLMSTNVRVNTDGAIEFRFTETIPPEVFTFNGDNYITFELISDSLSKISQISVTDGENKIVSGDSTGLSVNFQNPSITTQAQLDTVFNRVYPIEFYSYKIKTQGFPHISIGDMVQFEDIEGITREILIAGNKLIYSGGLSSEFTCEAVRGEEREVTMTAGSTIGQAQANFSKTMEQAILNATNLITGSEGGNVYIETADGKPRAIHIMDTDDINTAQKIWTWNKDGLGFTADGYGSPMKIAITSDGQIVADFITAGGLNAGIITSGKLQSPSGGAYIDLTDGSFSFGSSGVTFDSSGFTVGDKPIAQVLSEKMEQGALDELHTYLTYDKINGLQLIAHEYELGTENIIGTNIVQILGDKINFMDNGTVVAYIAQQKLWIENAEILDTLVINKHQFKRYNDDITIVTWLGV